MPQLCGLDFGLPTNYKTSSKATGIDSVDRASHIQMPDTKAFMSRRTNYMSRKISYNDVTKESEEPFQMRVYQTNPSQSKTIFANQKIAIKNSYRYNPLDLEKKKVPSYSNY
jgi:hypothetical protein